MRTYLTICVQRPRLTSTHLTLTVALPTTTLLHVDKSLITSHMLTIIPFKSLKDLDPLPTVHLTRYVHSQDRTRGAQENLW